MALSFLGGRALGVVVGQLQKLVVQSSKEISQFKTQLKLLERTLNRIEPLFEDITKYSQVLDRPPEETKNFINYLESAKQLIGACSNIKSWDLMGKYVHAKELKSLDEELIRFFETELQANICRNVTSIVIGNQELNEKIDRLFLTTDRSIVLPELPEVIIGNDKQLEQLKNMMFYGRETVVVVSGPGGCGKTTLVRMFCHDAQIKGMFGDNIFYITVSKPTNLKTIARTLIQKEFQIEEEAHIQIENFFRKMGQPYILLVLDNVWDGDESVIDKLRFQIRGYKILVTSRFIFPRFQLTYEMTTLNEEDSKTLFCHHALPSFGIPNVSDDLVRTIVSFCKGHPLSLTVVGTSLRGQPLATWLKSLEKLIDGQSVLQSHNMVLNSLQTSVDALDEHPVIKECFLDLGLFQENDMISSTILNDMWVELYNLKDTGLDTAELILDLRCRNLVNTVPTRLYGGDLFSGHYVTQHNLLRELAIVLCSQEPEIKRTRLSILICNNHFPKWWSQQINARVLSVTTDKRFDSRWCDLNAPNLEVLILNIKSEKYSLPQFLENMTELKTLIIRGCGTIKLQNLEVLSCLSKLRRISFDDVSVSNYLKAISGLPNLKKVAFYWCEIDNRLMSDENLQLPPNLMGLIFFACRDVRGQQLLRGRNMHLQKMPIDDHGPLIETTSLSYLETLIFDCCANRQKLPESEGNFLPQPIFVDISDFSSVPVLCEEEGGELSGLKVLNVRGCVNCLQHLTICGLCDEGTSSLWMNITLERDCRH